MNKRMNGLTHKLGGDIALGLFFSLSLLSVGIFLYPNAVSAESPASRSQTEKPLVHFPEDLNGQETPNASGNQTSATMTRQEQDARIQPVGFRPYTAPMTEAQGRLLESAVSHYNRGSYYASQNKMEEAVAEYQKALHLNPGFADAYVGLSTVSMRKNDWETVVDFAQKALNMKAGFMDSANVTQAQFNLSTAYCAADDYENAARYYRQARYRQHPDTERLWAFLEKNCKPLHP